MTGELLQLLTKSGRSDGVFKRQQISYGTNEDVKNVLATAVLRKGVKIVFTDQVEDACFRTNKLPSDYSDFIQLQQKLIWMRNLHGCF